MPASPSPLEGDKRLGGDSISGLLCSGPGRRLVAHSVAPTEQEDGFWDWQSASDLAGRLGGTRTPNLLIRRTGRAVRCCPSSAFTWGAVLCLSPGVRNRLPVGSNLGNSRGLSLACGACHSSAVYGADLRGLPKPQQRRIHLAVILGRPVPPHQAAVAAGHARHLRWISVVGGIIAVIGAAMLVATAFAPHAEWSSWLSAATFLVWGAIFLFFGINARRAARVYHHPGACGLVAPSVAGGAPSPRAWRRPRGLAH